MGRELHAVRDTSQKYYDELWKLYKRKHKIKLKYLRMVTYVVKLCRKVSGWLWYVTWAWLFLSERMVVTRRWQKRAIYSAAMLYFWSRSVFTLIPPKAPTNLHSSLSGWCLQTSSLGLFSLLDTAGVWLMEGTSKKLQCREIYFFYCSFLLLFYFTFNHFLWFHGEFLMIR